MKWLAPPCIFIMDSSLCIFAPAFIQRLLATYALDSMNLPFDPSRSHRAVAVVALCCFWALLSAWIVVEAGIGAPELHLLNAGKLTRSERFLEPSGGALTGETIALETNRVLARR